MIDIEELEILENDLWLQNENGKSFKAAGKLIEAIKIIAVSQNQIHKDLEWIKRKLKEEI